MLEKLTFTKRYILALTIIALLSTLAYFNLNQLLTIQSDNAKMIDISGKQRILTKQIAFFAIYYKIGNLKQNITLMENSHNKLLSHKMSKKLKNVYFGKDINLDKRVKDYLRHAKNFSIHRDGLSQNYVLKNSEKLLNYIEKSVDVYLEEAQAYTEKLKKVELYILFFTLTTLFFEAIFIFMPANKRINKKTKDLTREKDYSNAVIESSTNAIITLDKNLKIRTFNKMAEYIFGYTKKEMLNQSSFEKIIPRKFNILDKENEGQVKEIEAINKDNQTFPIRISFNTSGENEDLAIVLSVQDITKEKLNTKILQEQAKFAALGEMVAIIAHQWRQPLAQLNFNCMYIKKKLKDESLIEEAGKNQEIIQFMSDTITNFQNFYKKTDNNNFNPTESVKQALLLVESTLSLNQIEIINKIESTNTIFGNSNSLSQVILSIVQNMIDVIKLRKIANPKIYFTLTDNEKSITLSIKDNAAGIQVNPIEDIFKAFNSQKTTPSTGIGLYMAKLIIENKFNGTITASNIDNGALFTIILSR